MFGSVFKKRALPLISGWLFALLVITILIHPFGLSAEERLWQSNDLTYSSPTAVPDLLAKLDQSQRPDRILFNSLLAGPPTHANLVTPEETAASPVWIQVAVIPPAAFLHAPFLPRPPPAHLHLRTA